MRQKIRNATIRSASANDRTNCSHRQSCASIYFTVAGSVGAKKKKSDRKTQWRPEQMLDPRGTTLTSRPAKFPVGSYAFTCNGRFPINRLQPPINRTGRMMMTSSAAQFHPFTNSNLPPRYSSGAERCGKKKTPQSQTTKKWTTPVQIRLLPLYSVSSRTHRRLQFSGG